MLAFLEKLVASLWNRIRGRRTVKRSVQGVTLGLHVIDEAVTREPVRLSTTRRTTHIAVLGKTGSGKSSLLRFLAQQDIEADRGILYFDLHGDAAPFLLGVIAAREQKLGKSLAERLKNLPPRHFVVKNGADHWREASTLRVANPRVSIDALVGRAHAHYGRPRTEVESEIAERHTALVRAADDVLHGWE